MLCAGCLPAAGDWTDCRVLLLCCNQFNGEEERVGRGRLDKTSGPAGLAKDEEGKERKEAARARRRRCDGCNDGDDDDDDDEC